MSDDLTKQLKQLLNMGCIERLPLSAPPMGGQFIPFDLAEFIGRLVKTRSPKRMLDPSARWMLPLVLKSMLRPDRFDVFTEAREQAKYLSGHSDAKGISVCQTDGLVALNSSGTEYDAVVSCPPFGALSRNSVMVEMDGKELSIGGEYAHLLILEACRHLAPGGFAVFVVSNNYFSSRADKVKKVLAGLGFRTTAAIELQPGTFAPLTSIVTHIVVLERSENHSLFTGRFSWDQKHQRILLENLSKGIDGETPEEGRVALEDSFRGFSAIEQRERLVRAAKRQGLAPYPFSEVVLELNSPSSSKSFDGFEPKSNTVYLPQMATTKATTHQDDLPEKLKSYFQLVLNPKLANADFLAGLLNTSLGQLWRDTLRSGNTIPRISKNALEKSEIYLPEISEIGIQQKVAECQNYLTQLRMGVNELETRLWERPLSVRSIEKSVKETYREERYEDWLETLPFPLASILWSCHIQTGSLKDKYERKIHFFEALAEFLGIVHLSAFSSAGPIWDDARIPLMEALKQGNFSLKMATFGTWAITVGFFSKRSRGLLEKDEELLFELFKTRSRDLLGRIFSKKLVSVIQDVNKVRNDWLGHTGIVSDRDALQVNYILDKKMQTVREVFGLAWEEYQLLLPGECTYSNGSFNYKVKKIMGTRTPFATGSTIATEAMENGHLYLKSPDEPRGLKLLPLVKVLPSPKTEENACYFYNRWDKKGIRFLSYYFEGDAVVVDEFSDVALALEKLEPDMEQPA